MKKIAIFASGTGSNFERLADDQKIAQVAKITKLVCDKPNAPVIAKAQQRGIEVFAFNPKDYPSKADFEQAILEQVEDCDLVVLAGYMRVVSPYFLQHFKQPIINLHPSLLPAYKGKDAIERAFAAGEQEMGVSVHFVNEELDGGEVIAQAKLQRKTFENLPALTDRIHQLEHQLLPQVVYQLLTQ